MINIEVIFWDVNVTYVKESSSSFCSEWLDALECFFSLVVS